MGKALVLFSGGLDSRLVVKLLQEQGEVEAVFFKLPFGGGCCNDVMCSFRFSQNNNIKLHVIDCTKGKNLEEYLELVKHPKHGVGAGINPCIDCKLFMFRKAEKLKKKIKADFIATGEVAGQRPMSQNKHAFSIIDKRVAGIKRPLIELKITGRKRDKQMNLARKYKIIYPTPAGGCLLCEKNLARRFKSLIEKNLINEKTLPISIIGRHLWLKGWLVVARDEKESLLLEKYKTTIKSGKGKPAVYYDNEKNKSTALELQKAFQDKKQSKYKEYRL